MIDLLQGAQDALYDALAPIAALPGMPAGAAVYQHLPENTQPPYWLIGDLTTANEAGKDGQLEAITAEIHVVFRGEKRAPLLAMMHAARAILDGQTIEAPGCWFEHPEFVRAEAATALADGVTYVGVVIVKFFAQPA